MKNVIISLMAVGFFLAGCGAPGPEKVDSADNLVGVWRRVGGFKVVDLLTSKVTHMGRPKPASLRLKNLDKTKAETF